MSNLATRLVAACVFGLRRAGALAVAPMVGAGVMVGAGFFTVGLGSGTAEAKTPGKTYCFYRVCHRVKTLAETRAMVGRVETVSASFYDSCKKDRYNPCGLTSSGEVFRPEAADNAASPIYPNGTVLLVWSPDTQKSAVVRINNAGPYWGKRTLDVSRATAQALGFAKRGVARLKLRVLSAPTRAEATYKRKRRYDPVPGFIGQFASLDEAHIGAAQTYAVAALTAPGATTTTMAAVALAPAAAEGERVTATAPAPQVRVAAADAAPAIAAADATPAVAAEAVAAAPSEAKPVRVAALVEMEEVAEPAAAQAQAQPTSAKNMTSETVRTRRHAERSQPRNSRAYRTAQRKQVAARQRQPERARTRQQPERVRTRTAAAAPRVPETPRPITQDATNDMSVFSRHTHIGVSRLAAAAAERRSAY